MGGMKDRPHDTLGPMLGLNFGYEFGPMDSAERVMHSVLGQQTKPYDTTISLSDPFYYGTGTAPIYTSAWNLLMDAIFSTDVRCYLPGTSGITEEYSYPWELMAGHIGNSALHQDTVEWYIEPADAPDSAYVLRLVTGQVGAAGSLQSPGSSDPYQTGFFSYGNIASNHIGSFTYNFVFNFNSTHLATVAGTTPLYQLEFWRVKTTAIPP